MKDKVSQLSLEYYNTDIFSYFFNETVFIVYISIPNKCFSMSSLFVHRKID